MIRLRIAVCSILSVAISAVAQTPPPADAAKLLKTHQGVRGEWQAADAGLEREVFTGDPGDVLKRLRTAEAKRPDVSASKEAYLDAIRQRYEQQLTELRKTSPTRRGESRESIEVSRDTLLELTTDRTTIELDLKASPPPNAGEAAILRRQLAAVSGLQDLYQQRQQAIQKAAAAADAVEQSRVDLLRQFTESVSGLARASGWQEDERAAWNDYYHAIRRRAMDKALALSRRVTPDAAVAKPTVSPAPGATQIQPPVQPPSRPQAAQPGAMRQPAPERQLAGTWTLVAPRAEKFADAKGPLYGDVSTMVNIAPGGGGFTGVYTGTVFVPAGERYNPNVSFRFTAPAPAQGSPAVEGRIEPPLSGTVRIEWMDDSHIRLTYRIDRTPRAASISFKEGEAKVLRRR